MDNTSPKPRVDMSPQAVTARIRQCGEGVDFSVDALPSTKVDMSPDAVWNRIREAGELWNLCEQLRAKDPR
jgi:hypothetical protein